MQKLPQDVVDSEFTRFTDMNDLDVDTTKMSPEEMQDFARLKRTICEQIESGALVIRDNGLPTYTPQRSKNTDPIVFNEPTGASMMAMDRRKKNEDVAKMFSTMADMTEKDVKVFSMMAMKDLKVCLAITTLFLA